MRAREFLREYSRDVTAKTLGAKLLAAAQADPRMGLGRKPLEPQVQQQVIDHVLAEIEKRDPTPNKTYTPWMARVYSNGGTRLEDLNFNNILAVYDQAKRRRQLAAEHKDINRFKTWADFSAMMEPYLQNADVTSTVSNNERARGNYKRIIKTADGQAIQLMDKAACIYYGQNSKWCTSATESDNRADDYLSWGDIYVFIPTQPSHPGEKYQLALRRGYEGYDSDELSNEKNHEVSLNQVHQRMPELVNKFVEQFPQTRRLITGDMYNLTMDLMLKSLVFLKPEAAKILKTYLLSNRGRESVDNSTDHTENVWASNYGLPVMPDDFPGFISDCLFDRSDFMFEFIDTVLEHPGMFGIDAEEFDFDEFQEYMEDHYTGILDRTMVAHPVIWDEKNWTWKLK